MKKGIVLTLVLSSIISVSTKMICYGEQIIVAQKVAQKVDKSPVIDGRGNDSVWEKAQAIVTHDKVADIDITIKAAYTGKEICFVVSFPDPDESRVHKSWIWDKEMKIYKMGPDREDVFVIKWNMLPQSVDLSVHADNYYKADIWFWKACRTDPVGFADDKIQCLGSEKMVDSTKVTSRSGKDMYLLRKEDTGEAAYKTELPPPEYTAEVIPRFINLTPTGSRADIKAKGIWKDGRWTVEFKRVFNTGNNDDIQFDLTKSYQFAVSRYEIASRKLNPKTTQPLYGSGDTSEIITLVFGN